MPRSFFFWQNFPAIHQEAMLVALADSTSVTLVCEEDVPRRRLEMGWQRPDFIGCNVVVAPTMSERLTLLEGQDRNCVNVFSGIGAYPMVHRSFLAARKLSRAVNGLYLEPWRSGRGYHPNLRSIKYSAKARLHARYLDFVLATGETALQQYGSTSFGPDRVYEFGYFVNATETTQMFRENDRSELIFVGKVDQRKRLGFLLTALASCTDRKWHLRVVGDGPLLMETQNAAEQLGISERIDWLGYLGNEAVREELFSCDLLILPSTFDGWGAVVNEALHAGCPALVSDQVGAASIVKGSGMGGVFATNSIESLTSRLSLAIEAGPLEAEKRSALREWADSRIGGVSAAAYLQDIVANATQETKRRPVPPWKSYPRPS